MAQLCETRGENENGEREREKEGPKLVNGLRVGFFVISFLLEGIKKIPGTHINTFNRVWVSLLSFHTYAGKE